MKNAAETTTTNSVESNANSVTTNAASSESNTVQTATAAVQNVHVHVLESGDSQYRSKKAKEYAEKLARKLRDLTACGSAHSIAKYCTIDDILEAIEAAESGYTVKFVY